MRESTVDVITITNTHWRKHTRHGTRCSNGHARVATLKHDRLTATQISGHDGKGPLQFLDRDIFHLGIHEIGDRLALDNAPIANRPI